MEPLFYNHPKQSRRNDLKGVVVLELGGGREMWSLNSSFTVEGCRTYEWDSDELWLLAFSKTLVNSSADQISGQPLRQDYISNNTIFWAQFHKAIKTSDTRKLCMPNSCPYRQCQNKMKTVVFHGQEGWLIRGTMLACELLLDMTGVSLDLPHIRN